jgi:hypothetical protein
MTEVLELTEERTEERTDAKTIAGEFAEAFTRLAPEERAYRVACSFLQIECPTDAMRGQFYEWLRDGHDRQAKQEAMARIAREHFGRD